LNSVRRDTSVSGTRAVVSSQQPMTSLQLDEAPAYARLHDATRHRNSLKRDGNDRK
jgi:hypothetical protein